MLLFSYNIQNYVKYLKACNFAVIVLNYEANYPNIKVNTHSFSLHCTIDIKTTYIFDCTQNINFS